MVQRGDALTGPKQPAGQQPHRVAGEALLQPTAAWLTVIRLLQTWLLVAQQQVGMRQGVASPLSGTTGMIVIPARVEAPERMKAAKMLPGGP